MPGLKSPVGRSSSRRVLAESSGRTILRPRALNWTLAVFRAECTFEKAFCLPRVPHMFRKRSQNGACSVPLRTQWSSSSCKNGLNHIAARVRHRFARLRIDQANRG
jgi:hypothetical protein